MIKARLGFKRLIIMPVALVFLCLTACGGGDSPKDPLESEIKTFSYRGEKIDCVKTGSVESQTMACDFDFFYRKNPKLLSDFSENSEKDVKWVEHRGKVLACINSGRAESTMRSCDFKRFYAANPALFDR